MKIMTKLKPNGKRVLVKLDDNKVTDIGGIILPDDNDQTPPREGEITAIGQVDGLAVGYKVIISKNGGVEVKVDGEIQLIVDVDDVVAILK